MEYGKYQIVKIDNDGEQVINTYKGLGAMEDALEEFMSWCADHEEDDQWVAKKYRNMLEGYDGEGMQKLLDWLDRNGYIEETFLSGKYSLKMKDMSEDKSQFSEAASALFDKSYVEVVKITDGGKEESRCHWYDLDQWEAVQQFAIGCAENTDDPAIQEKYINMMHYFDGQKMEKEDKIAAIKAGSEIFQSLQQYGFYQEEYPDYTIELRYTEK